MAKQKVPFRTHAWDILAVSAWAILFFCSYAPFVMGGYRRAFTPWLLREYSHRKTEITWMVRQFLYPITLTPHAFSGSRKAVVRTCKAICTAALYCMGLGLGLHIGFGVPLLGWLFLGPSAAIYWISHVTVRKFTTTRAE